MINCEFGRSFILIEADLRIDRRLRGTTGSCNSPSVRARLTISQDAVAALTTIFGFTLTPLCVSCAGHRAHSAGEVASSARRHAPSKRHTYVFDKASQATSISSGGLWGCRG